jgi:hypothetical protein
VDHERVVCLAGCLRDRDRGGVGEPVGRADDEVLEQVARVEAGLRDAADAGRRGLALGPGRHELVLVVVVIVVQVVVLPVVARGVCRHIVLSTLMSLDERGLDRDDQPGLLLQRRADGVLEGRPDPGLELGSREVVLHGDDQDVVVQRQRLGGVDPHLGARGERVDGSLPDSVEMFFRAGFLAVVHPMPPDTSTWFSTWCECELES